MHTHDAQPIDPASQIPFPGTPFPKSEPPPEPKMQLSREAMLRADDMRIEWVPVPEWATQGLGNGTYVKSLEGTERDAFDESLTVTRRQGRKTTRDMVMANARAKLVALAACTETGEKVFFENDIVLLGKKSAKALQRIFEVAMRLSGMTEEEIENLGKDSTSDQNGASGSDSPATSV